MNLKELIAKMTAIEEGKDTSESIEIIGSPLGSMMGHDEPPKQQDNVTMNVSLNGAGAGGVRDLMNILHNIEAGVSDGDDHSTEHDHEEPVMGDMVRSMGHEEQVGEEFENSVHGHEGPREYEVSRMLRKGNDMHSKGKGALKHNGGENPMHEALVDRLSQMYQQIKEAQVGHDYQTGEPLKQGPDGKWRNSKGEERDLWSGGPMLAPDKPKYRGLVAPQPPVKEERTEEKDEKGNVVRWKEETPWRKAQNKDGRGKVTNMSDKARRESEKLSKKEPEKMDESVSQMLALNKVLNG